MRLEEEEEEVIEDEAGGGGGEGGGELETAKNNCVPEHNVSRTNSTSLPDSLRSEPPYSIYTFSLLIVWLNTVWLREAERKGAREAESQGGRERGREAERQ